MLNHRINKISIGVFLKGRVEKARSCLKASEYQTGRGEKMGKLSEGNQASDRSRSKKHEAVRKQASIGQVGEKKPRSCLKASEYRTGRGEKSKELSESKRASGSSRRSKHEAVRRQSGIGQFGEKKARSCPKSSEYRTGRGEKAKKLSEGKQASDRSRSKKHKAV
jgi:hypothetical protein